jgi:RNA polymerase sigma-70 factor (ECF subfamily)
MVYAFCLRSLRDRAESEDVMTEIFFELWDRHERYDSTRGSPLAYLLRLTRSRIVDRLRSKQSRRRNDDILRSSAPDVTASGAAGARQSGPLGTALLMEQRSQVLQALKALTDGQRAVVELAFYETLSHVEIAQRLGEPLGTIKSRIRQALKRLRESLGGIST